MAVETHDGEWDWLERNKVRELAQKAPAYGVRVDGWYYSVGDWTGCAVGCEGTDEHTCTMAAELDLVGRSLETGVEFQVADIEMEWARQPGRRDDPAEHAARYVAEMRRRFPEAMIGATTVPRVV